MGTASRVIRYTLTIPSGQTNSNVAVGWMTYGGSAGLSIHSPAGLAETVNIQVSPLIDAVSETDPRLTWSNWFDGSPLTQQTVPPAGDAASYVTLVTNGAIRLQASGAVGGTRIFYLTFQATF